MQSVSEKWECGTSVERRIFGNVLVMLRKADITWPDLTSPDLTSPHRLMIVTFLTVHLPSLSLYLKMGQWYTLWLRNWWSGFEPPSLFIILLPPWQPCAWPLLCGRVEDYFFSFFPHIPTKKEMVFSFLPSFLIFLPLRIPFHFLSFSFFFLSFLFFLHYMIVFPFFPFSPHQNTPSLFFPLLHFYARDFFSFYPQFQIKSIPSLLLTSVLKILSSSLSWI